MSASSPAPVGELRAVRRGGFTISRLHRSGSDPFRALLIGSRAVIGPTHPVSDARWFAEHLADRTWLRLRRGVDLDVLWELRPVLQAIRGSADSWRLWRYDVVVIMLAATTGGSGARLRLAGVPRLVAAVLERIAALSRVLVVTFDPAAGRPAVRHSGEDPASVERITVPRDARDGADRLAAAFAAADPDTDRPRQPSPRPTDEPGRLEALRELDLQGRAVSPELLRLVRGAQQAFDTDLVSINVLEDERAVALAVSGGVRAMELPRRLALCNLAIASRDAVLVEDAWAHPELSENPLLHGPRPIRFFAAYPIESVDGHRIGAFCLYDAEPRSADEVDVGLLRDLALLAEAEIAQLGR